jgi:hypothetical protein
MPRLMRDLAGIRFGRLVAVAVAGRDKHGSVRWRFRCDCGAETTVTGSEVTRGKTRSCGCLAVDALRDRSSKHGELVAGGRTPEWDAWASMRARCENKEHAAYARYGGRGITVCEAWSSFEAFLRDMGRRPTSGHSLDRINNDDGYGPTNCRWATKREQNRNRRSNVLLTHDGRTMCLVEWAETLGVTPEVIGARLSRGLTASESLTRPFRSRAAPGRARA